MGALGIPTPPKPNRDQLKRMADLAHQRMSQGGARILDEVEDLVETVKKVIKAGMDRAATEDQSTGCKVCGKKPDSGFRLALDGVMVANKQWELIGRLLGEIRDREQVHVVHLAASPEWERLRRTIANALLPYPDAARAVAAALRTNGNFAGNDFQDAEVIETPPAGR